MDERLVYQIEIQGLVDEKELNANSPLLLKVVQAKAESTLLSLRTDQSGLIGLLRHLHTRGYMLISLQIEKKTVL
ncbi:MAG: hypothetical protein JXR32_01870 [Anaerolineaceae bacterium]|nr:hypothetical protein [Anaerolineaceae bacterium]